MRARIVRFDSLDVDLRTYVPADPFNDAIWLRMYVGPQDHPGEESFDVLICTPAWLQGIALENGPQIGRHHLIVAEIDLPIVQNFLSRAVEQLDEASWEGLAEKIGRIGSWEFEDYRP